MKITANFIALFVMGSLACSTLALAEPDEFEKYMQEQQAGVDQEQADFLKYKQEVTQEYDNYVAEQERLFKEYKGQIEQKWGANNIATSTIKEYVSYEPNYSSRSSVDFETGTAKVQVLVTEEEAKNPQVVEQKLKEQVAQVVVAKGGNDPLEKKNAVRPTKKPILAGQLATKDGQPVTEKNAKKFAEQSVQAAQVSKEVVNGKDGVKRVMVGVQLKLVPNHDKKRALDYREQVFKEADRFGIDRTLVFAIMHTESYFNPMARSAVPAYGLMQLVPKSGGRDAYMFAKKQDVLVTGEYLYISENNIELGTALLTKLLTVEFRNVRDPKSKVYCAISAYNTGAGNVARAFTGKRKGNVKEAVPMINAMTSDQVFEYLKQNLPFEETRSYVAKVSGRMGQYNEWAKD